jgi:hypothetical protein
MNARYFLFFSFTGMYYRELLPFVCKDRRKWYTKPQKLSIIPPMRLEVSKLMCWCIKLKWFFYWVEALFIDSNANVIFDSWGIRVNDGALLRGLFLLRVNRPFLQIFNKFGNLGREKKSPMPKEILKWKKWFFWNWNWNFIFEFWKKFGHTTRGKLKKRFWKLNWNLKTLIIPPEGNEKNWNMPRKSEMKTFENWKKWKKSFLKFELKFEKF